MKKILSIILITSMFLSMATSVFSAGGDVIGSIYSTDIKACINGVWVDSYNIGGRTVVVVEDITKQISYYDTLRTLIIDEFSPHFLVSGGNSYTEKPGIPVGKIYETDIKTYFRGKELACYSLDGRMAIEIEQLGDDNTFSDIGGRYIWNEKERTITLESIYRYPYSMRTMLEDKHFDIVLQEGDGVLKAEPVKAALDGGHILCETEIADNSIVPVTYNDEVIGYRCKFPNVWVESDENCEYILKTSDTQPLVEHYYVDKVNKIISELEPVQLTAQDWLNYFEKHTMMTVKDSFETDEYVFLYAFFSGIHSGTDKLIKLNKSDGERVDFDENFESVSLYGQKRFENVIIDRENEKVYLHYDVDYIINLKTDTILRK